MTEKTHNLLVRAATGVVVVAVVLAAMLSGEISYTLLLVCLAAGCIVEFWNLAQKPAQRWSGALYIALCMGAMWFFPVIGSGMGGHGGILGRAVPLFPAGGFGFGHWDVRIAPAFILTVWANDVFAYLVGIAFGRHKMSPRISPHKTWEGFAGGIVGGATVAALVGRFWAGGDVWLWIAFGLVVALAAVAGDLAESWFKRAAGVKDSGRLLPGHGGLLDRFDAMLGAVPVAFLFFIITLLFK
jgi:phosphatidate cytidylyltransferase